MPAITYDGRSFLIDGRRIWITSGAIHYFRVPRDEWATRIAQARAAGLNCIETPVHWALHEPRPGTFNFTGDADLRRFVELIHQAKMWCILRLGPYIGSGLDLGGLPAWLLDNPALQLRTANAPFLEACSRFIGAVAGQVRDLQITAIGSQGPILLVQNESKWECGREGLAESYLGELHRYLRESGFTVPTVNSNNLWPHVENEIDGWSGSDWMLASMRQLSVVKPTRPRLVIDFAVTQPETFGAPPCEPPEPWEVQRRVAEILAGGAQVNIDPFHAGTNFGFTAGRLVGPGPGYVTPGAFRHAPLDESGSPGPCHDAVRRVCLFSTHFGRVFSHLEPEYRPVALDPEGNTLSIVHRRGTQGDVVFLFSPQARERRARGPVQLLLADGSSLEVELGEQSVAWILLNTHLGGRATLDHCTLCPLAQVGKTLVFFGPAGAKGVISINGSPIDVDVPSGKKPEVIEHEGLALVICAEAAVPFVQVTEDRVYLGTVGLSSEGRPIATTKNVSCVDAHGRLGQEPAELAPARPAKAPSLGAWEVSETRAYLNGSSARYATIDGPADLARLGAPAGYGWYRVTPKAGPGRAKALAPQCADRALVFGGGECTGVLGFGPGASAEVPFTTRKSAPHVVILADNMGRMSAGASLGDQRGVYGHLYEGAALKSVKPRLVVDAPVEPLAFRAPLWQLRDGDDTDPERITWTVTRKGRSPLALRIIDLPARALLMVGGAPVRFLERGATESIVLDDVRLGKGAASIQFATLTGSIGAHEREALLKQFSAAVEVFELGDPITDKAEWAFAKWELPARQSFASLPKTAKSLGVPAWFRSHFPCSPVVPLALDLAGLTKGQVYVNGRHLGRYFVATGEGAPVGPHTSLTIPGAWLHAGNNELVIFDEHGATPARCRLTLLGDGAPAPEPRRPRPVAKSTRTSRTSKG